MVYVLDLKGLNHLTLFNRRKHPTLSPIVSVITLLVWDKRQNAMRHDSGQVRPVDNNCLNRHACETPVAPEAVASRPSDPRFKTFTGPEPRLQTRDFNAFYAQINWHTYLDRQGRNEYITLASQITYDGNNIAFVFYENQIRRLMDESPLEEVRRAVLKSGNLKFCGLPA